MVFLARRTSASVQASAEGSDDRHQVLHQILSPLFRFIDNHQFTAMGFEQRLDIGHAKARTAIFVFHDDMTDAGISQEREKLWASCLE